MAETIVDGNIRGAARESGELAKVLRGVTGISVRDIEKYGVFGGPNSVFRKPFGPAEVKLEPETRALSEELRKKLLR